MRRGPFLAEFELLQQFNKKIEADKIQNYFEMFCNKLVCFSDLKPYLLSCPELVGKFAKMGHENFSNDIHKITLFYQIRHFLGIHHNLEFSEKVDLAKQLYQLHLQHPPSQTKEGNIFCCWDILCMGYLRIFCFWVLIFCFWARIFADILLYVLIFVDILFWVRIFCFWVLIFCFWVRIFADILFYVLIFVDILFWVRIFADILFYVLLFLCLFLWLFSFRIFYFWSWFFVGAFDKIWNYFLFFFSPPGFDKSHGKCAFGFFIGDFVGSSCLTFETTKLRNSDIGSNCHLTNCSP